MAVRAVPGGSEVAVFCQPGAARSAIVGLHAGQLKVKVTAPAVGGKANEALLDLLAAAAGVPVRCLRLVAGEHSRRKRVQAAGMDAGPLAAALARGLASAPLGPFV